MHCKSWLTCCFHPSPPSEQTHTPHLTGQTELAMDLLLSVKASVHRQHGIISTDKLTLISMLLPLIIRASLDSVTEKRDEISKVLRSAVFSQLLR